MASRAPSPDPQFRIFAVVMILFFVLSVLADVSGTLTLSVSQMVTVMAILGTGAVVGASMQRLAIASTRPWWWLTGSLAALLSLGALLGYMHGPQLVSKMWAPSRDADVLGYCIEVMNAKGFEPLKDRTLPRAREGQFFCTGSKQPVNMERACRWKWGPQAKPPTLENESDSFSWRCHPKYR